MLLQREVLTEHFEYLHAGDEIPTIRRCEILLGGLLLALTTTRTAKQRIRNGAGLETLVDTTATVILVLASIVALGLLMTFSLWGVAASACTVLGGYVQWLMLRCLAEHLRLLKKIAGCQFAGRITGPAEETIWICNHCGQMLHSETRCDSCNAEIVLNGG